MSRQTLTTFEHRSWGAGRVYDLAPWPMGYYTRMLAGMLAWDEGDDELVYCRATPRTVARPGQTDSRRAAPDAFRPHLANARGPTGSD